MDNRIARNHFPRARSRRTVRLDMVLVVTLTLLLLAFLGFSTGTR